MLVSAVGAEKITRIVLYPGVSGKLVESVDRRDATFVIWFSKVARVSSLVSIYRRSHAPVEET